MKKSFKPYYKWIIFNIIKKNLAYKTSIISFKPYYKWIIFNISLQSLLRILLQGFKPYYKWIIFNMKLLELDYFKDAIKVLNLIING